jgi:hypothetical protein
MFGHLVSICEGRAPGHLVRDLAANPAGQGFFRENVENN